MNKREAAIFLLIIVLFMYLAKIDAIVGHLSDLAREGGHDPQVHFFGFQIEIHLFWLWGIGYPFYATLFALIYYLSSTDTKRTRYAIGFFLTVILLAFGQLEDFFFHLINFIPFPETFAVYNWDKTNNIYWRLFGTWTTPMHFLWLTSFVMIVIFMWFILLRNSSQERKLTDKLVSFIITTKNEEAYLSRCLKAIRKQTYRNVEIIVVDSCSKDRTVEIARKYADNVIVRDCIIPIGRNIGAKNSSGKFLVFVDADIVLNENWLEIALSQLDDETIAICGDLFPDGNGFKDKLLYCFLSVTKTIIFRIGIPNIGHSGTAVLVRRETFDKVNGYPTDVVSYEDIAFTSKIKKHGIVKFCRKLNGHFSLRFFKKYGYVNRLLYWCGNFLNYLLGKPDMEYRR